MGVLLHLEMAQKRNTKDATKTMFCEKCGKNVKVTSENVEEECPICGSKEVRPN